MLSDVCKVWTHESFAPLFLHSTYNLEFGARLFACMPINQNDVRFSPRKLVTMHLFEVAFKNIFSWRATILLHCLIYVPTLLQHPFQLKKMIFKINARSKFQILMIKAFFEILTNNRSRTTQMHISFNTFLAANKNKYIINCPNY